MACKHHVELRKVMDLSEEITDREIEIRLLAAMEYMVLILRVKYGMDAPLWSVPREEETNYNG